MFQFINAVIYSSGSCLPMRAARHWQLPKGSCPDASSSNMAPLEWGCNTRRIIEGGGREDGGEESCEATPPECEGSSKCCTYTSTITNSNCNCFPRQSSSSACPIETLHLLPNSAHYSCSARNSSSVKTQLIADGWQHVCMAGLTDTRRRLAGSGTILEEDGSLIAAYPSCDLTDPQYSY